MKASYIMLLIVLVFLCGCSPKLSVTEMSGIYTMKNNGGVDCIKLFKNGYYKHEFIRSDGDKEVQMGSWNIETFQAGRTVVLKGFEALSGEKTTGEGFYLLLIENSWWGASKLITNIDTDDGYVKASICGKN